VAIALLDEATGLFHLTVLYAVPIIIATGAFGLVGGLITVALAVLSVGVTHSLLHSPTVLADVVTDLVVFLFAAFSVDRLRTQLRTIRALETQRDLDLGIARDIQRRMLRQAPDDDRFETACVLDFAREVGGDYYRFAEVNDKLMLFAGDISGKGMAAALFASLLDQTIGDALANFKSLDMFADKVNERMYDSLPADMFITMLFVMLDDEGIGFVNAGHIRPLHFVGATGEVIELSSGTRPLGIDAQLEVTLDSRTLEPGDVLLICSDGVTESPALIRRPGVLESTFKSIADQGPLAVVDQIRRLAESKGQTDDITVICIRRR